jgi:hypothetical protein
MTLPGFHLEHPTASEGCRSASQGLTLTLNADGDRTERFRRTSMAGPQGRSPVRAAKPAEAARSSRSPSRPSGRTVDAPSSVCFDPLMETTGQAHTVLLDPFWVSRRADQFDQICR